MRRLFAIMLAVQLAGCSIFAVRSQPAYDPAARRWRCADHRTYAMTDFIAGGVMLVGGISTLIYQQRCDDCSDKLLLIVPLGVLLGLTYEVAGARGVAKGRACRRRLEELDTAR